MVCVCVCVCGGVCQCEYSICEHSQCVCVMVCAAVHMVIWCVGMVNSVCMNMVSVSMV